MIDPNLITTVRVGELPPEPLTLESRIPHEIGVDLKYGTIQNLLDLLRPLVGKLQFEKVVLYVNTQYIFDNFDVTGLGTNLCLGFAICNGQNGTPNVDGRSGIGYGATYNFVGLTGGYADSTLIEHSHTAKISNVTGGDPDRFTAQNGGSGGGTTTDNGTGIVNTGLTGGSGTNRNYHPYIVELTIMKL